MQAASHRPRHDIELAQGHKHVVCKVNSRGDICSTEDRRL
jgi:hypothetical protein